MSEKQVSDPSYESYRQEAEDQLWMALDALEKGDLSTVRSCTARVKRDTVDYWQGVYNKQ